MRFLSVLTCSVLLVLSASSLARAQFDPEITTSFSSLDAGEAADLAQELTLFEDDSDFSSLLMTFDIGSFDFDSIEVDDEIGSMAISVTMVISTPAGIAVTRTGTISCDVVVTIIDDDTVEAEIIATDVDDAAETMIEAAGGDDPTDEVVFNVLISASDLTLELTDNAVLPTADDFGADIDIEWKLEAGYAHAGAGGTLTVTDLFTATDDSESEVTETFELEGGGNTFMRGDVDGNGSVSALIDSLGLLNWAFAGGDEPICFDAADADNSGTVSALIDALRILNWAFSGGDAPPDPGPTECGVDPEGDDCDESSC